MKKDKRTTKARRKFLKAAGKFAVYTPPALLMMTNASAKGFVNSMGKCNQGVGAPVVNDGCQPGHSGDVLNNDDFPGAGAGNPGARNK